MKMEHDQVLQKAQIEEKIKASESKIIELKKIKEAEYKQRRVESAMK